MNNESNNQINIELNEEVAQGVYSNLAIISHSNSEFVVDFVRIVPGIPKAKVKSRILLTPDKAKSLLVALQENVRKYEQNFGTIKVQQDNGSVIPIDFGNNPLA